MTISPQINPSDVRRANFSSRLAGTRGLQRRQSNNRRVLLLDTLTVLTVVCIAQVGRFWILPTADTAERSTWHVTGLSIALAALWLTMLGLQRTRDLSLVGQGAEEYRRVVTATVWTFGVFAVIVVLLELPISRGFLVIALLAGLPALLLERHLLQPRTRLPARPRAVPAPRTDGGQARIRPDVVREPGARTRRGIPDRRRLRPRLRSRGR